MAILSSATPQLIQIIEQNPIICIVLAPILIFAIYILANEVYRYNLRIPSFSGPVGHPIYGNILQTGSNPAEQYKQWGSKYGDVYQVQLGNNPILIVNSASKAKEIFLSNSRSTNSRPMTYTFHRIVSSTAGFTIGSSPMDESLKRRRKAAASALNKPAVQSYVPHIDLETEEFIRDVFVRGKAGKVALNPLPIVRRLSLNLSLTLNWGTRISSIDDPLFNEIIEVEDHVSSFRSVTANLQDYVPFYRLNPFSKDSKLAAETRQRRDVYLTKLNKELDEKIANKTYKPCIQANVLLDPEAKLSSEELMSLSVTMINAGLDTVIVTIVWGIALLATRPDIQEKAYMAIRDMFPENEPFCDPSEDQKCAYVTAFVRETLRYFTPLRLSLPRTTSSPFMLDGKKVPKGTTFFMNTWACNYDPQLYDKPEEFRPERFLENPGLSMFSYGTGSRMCAGSLLGNRELYLFFMRLISSYEILKHDNINVDPLTGVKDYGALGSLPYDYKVIFKPRNEAILSEALDNYKPAVHG
ncbi:C-22 sterol desaturase [Sugiyamaella lignohabitans]|uniref:C-22 sterol desaturase n=1 Tax=Sugiyamaella lignohabitans TaxID=796027 RepID=A0A167EM08_9ASCO|nr:C-22 sterol desaturase [Sugiyamaella lignohabitans]ANB14235.1 C-22 sterol desaturase [Sugiyamaella lignohabitans]